MQVFTIKVENIIALFINSFRLRKVKDFYNQGFP